MNLTGKILDILFRRIPAEKLLRRIPTERGKRRVGFPPSSKEFRLWFLDVAETTLSGYSQDEQELIFQKIEESITKTPHSGGETSRWILPFPPFRLLADYGDIALERRSDDIFCRFSKVLDWRDTYLCLGQDLIVTAWMASTDPLWIPASYSWPAVIPTNNRNLDCILNGGISENHYHLYGSSAVFALNWCRLMTWPDLGEDGAAWLENSLQLHASRGIEDNQRSMRERLLFASFIRALLFRKLQGESVQCMEELRRFEASWESSGKRRLFADTDILRFQYGMKFPQPNGEKPQCLDYAFTRCLYKERENDFRILSGERWLLFHCFRACFFRTSQSFDIETQWIFYLYLLLKAQFREEIVQTNHETGFRNFQNYERRKYRLWDLPGDSPGTGAYWNEALRTAVLAPLREQPIRSLELRISPRASMEDNLDNIYSIDQANWFFRDGRGFPQKNNIDTEISKLENMRSFFVLHFIKEPDHSDKEIPRYACRHQDLRKKARQQAASIVHALSRHRYLCRRIRGIDACSNEIGCRPEVFAVPFRFLQTCPTWKYTDRHSYSSGEHPLLSASYHAGEDFLDIASGLRAIDEAVCFLNLKRGSRIGHALALGVDPVRHYRSKHHCVVLPKQDLLDNLVWLLYRSEELNVEIEPVLREFIQNQSEDLLTELYRRPLSSSAETAEFSLRDYYNSWILRGDEPTLYASGKFDSPKSGDEFADFARNPWKEWAKAMERCRHHHKTVKLFHAYHYSREIKERGRKTEQFPIREDYARLMRQIQRSMQTRLDALGIGIECNPSSNMLIGTFESYPNHPIFQFYDLSPHHPGQMPSLHVSLNTDDQGIFETSLSFEYALVAAALQARLDEEGRRLYTDREIEEYIRNLQRMSNEQMFPDLERGTWR